MFEKKKQKIISKAIESACFIALPSFEAEIENLVAMMSSGKLSEDEGICAVHHARNNYLEKTYEIVYSGFETSGPSVIQKMKLAMLNPSIIGLPEEVNDTVIQNGPSAGLVFCWAFYALTGKDAYFPGVGAERHRLSHFQGQLIDEVLSKYA